MHEINLCLVKPSPNPIRKTWDEQKMQELAQSIKEQGVIVPIKVRPVLYWCEYCGESFDRIVKHCPNCDHHLLPSSFDECKYCYADISNVEPTPQMAESLTLNGDITLEPYEIVYGHRRVEAAKRAGLETIPAIIDSDFYKMANDFWLEVWDKPLKKKLAGEEINSVFQQLIENLSNEDMSAYEKGKAIEKLKQQGFSIAEQSRRVGVNESLMYRWRRYYLELQSGVRIPSDQKDEMIEHVEWTASVIKDDLPAKQAIINKAAKENLDRFETRAVADAVVKADTPELKQSVLDTSGKLGDADRILDVAKSKVAGRNVADGQEVMREKAFQEFDSAVKDFLDSIKMFKNMIKAARNAAKYGKFSPEAKPFTIGKLESMKDEIDLLIEELRNDQ